MRTLIVSLVILLLASTVSNADIVINISESAGNVVMETSGGTLVFPDVSTGGGASSKDKGRGSYKCGRVSAALVMSYSLAVV